MEKIKGLLSFTTKLNTDVKVVNEAVFSATTGFKKWKILGITFFGRDYDESIGKVEFIDKDSEKKQTMGFGNKKKTD